METLIIRTESDKLQQIKDFLKSLQISFEIKKEENQDVYNQEFIKKIEQNKKDYKNGKVKKITLEELRSLWK